MNETERTFDVDNVTRRIGAREHAKELIEFIDSEVAMEQTAELRFVILDLLAERFGTITREVVTEERMTDAGSMAFERQQIAFGMHSGMPIADVPMDYLLWLECEPDFRRDLRRYLRSDRIQREQGDVE
jgi:hypothetical protein